MSATSLFEPQAFEAPTVAARAELGWGEVILRVVDVCFALIAMVALAPVVIVTALAIRATSSGPAIFRQPRVGRGGRLFTVLKFRTMHVDADEEAHLAYVRQFIGTDAEEPTDGRLYKLIDARITPLGRFLRKTSIDEIPQLWNVLRGEMSLVGPRPVVPVEVALYPDWYHARFGVTPGMTGLWQVSGRSRLTYEQMVKLDVEFVARRSLRLYFLILLLTVPAIIFRRETG